MVQYDDLKNKNVLITGASYGIGRKICMDLLSMGACVYGLARSKEKLEEITEGVKDKGENFTPIVADLSNAENIQNAIQSVSKLDILIHNAAYFEPQSLENTSLEIWNKHLTVNLTAPFLLTSLLWEKLQRSKYQEGASIIFINSLAGVPGKEKFPMTSAYTSSKMGLLGLCEVVAAEGKNYNIRANCISPGSVDTKMFRDSFPHLTPTFKPENISAITLYYASKISFPISGANVVVSV